MKLHRRTVVAASSIAVTTALLSALKWIYVSPRDGMLAECIVPQLTGYYCPACGGLRATYDILHGDILGGLGNNFLVVLVFYAVVSLATRSVLSLLRPSWKSYVGLVDLKVAWLAVFLIPAFGIARNFEALAFLQPM